MQMGYSYGQDDAPKMCFNGPKTYQQNWFPSQYTTLTDDLNWSGNIYHSTDVAPTGGMFVIKLSGRTSSSSSDAYDDIYVSYNKYAGENSGTVEGRNQVAIHSAQSDDVRNAPKSLLLAKLSASGTYEVVVQGNDVIITVDAIDTSANPPYATVTIASGTESPSTSQSPSLSVVPSQIPSSFPSSMPSPVDGITMSPSQVYFTLVTDFLAGEYWAASKGGIMFDITVTEDVLINGFDIDLFYVNYGNNDFSTDVKIFIKEGTWEGYQADAGAWTEHMGSTSVTPPDELDFSTVGLTPITSDVMSPIGIAGGTTLGIYITNIDSRNFIEMAYDTTAVEHDDGVVKVETGIFQKYAEFQDVESDAFWYVKAGKIHVIAYIVNCLAERLLCSF